MTKETRQQLFNYLSNELGVTALESNLNEIERIINPRKFPYIEEDNLSKEPISEDERELAMRIAGTRDKPFFVDTVRSLVNSYLKEEISTSKLVEELNITAFKWKEQYTNSKLEEIHKEITRLQEKYDENGYEANPLIKLQRIEQHIDLTFEIYKNLAQRKLEEIEKWCDEKIKEYYHPNEPIASEKYASPYKQVKSKIQSLK